MRLKRDWNRRRADFRKREKINPDTAHPRIQRDIDRQTDWVAKTLMTDRDYCGEKSVSQGNPSVTERYKHATKRWVCPPCGRLIAYVRFQPEC